ncbi:hypothetical protein ACSS6W_004967 [Trichoderma asperelloides]
MMDRGIMMDEGRRMSREGGEAAVLLLYQYSSLLLWLKRGSVQRRERWTKNFVHIFDRANL